MEREIHILFVDDIWCRPEKQSIIRADFGELQRRDVPYVFHYETAETGPGRYGVDPVMTAISGIPDLRAVILDIMFGDKGDRLGLDILQAVRETYPTLPVFMMTSLDKDQIEVVERAMEYGANEYLVKKPTLDELERVLSIYTDLSFAGADYAIWGNSAPIRKVRADIVRVASGGSASVMITGESGTGKELIARAIHRQGPRRNGPFVAVHAASLSPTVLESELFGHEKGAFTGATGQRKGRFEMADKGVLFLDEISEIDPSVQVKLLRVLEERKFERVGGNETVDVDIRLIVATNKDLKKLVAEGKFREDLLYRLDVLHIHAPPLRDRLDDIKILADLFLRRLRETVGGGYKARSLSTGAREALECYSWPGNIRELRNAMEKVILLCREEEIGSRDLPGDILGSKASNTSGGAVDIGLPADSGTWARHRIMGDLRLVVEALERTGGNATQAAKYLFPEVNNPSSTTIKRYVKRLQKNPWGIEPNDEIKSLIQRIQDSIGKGRK